MRNGKIRKTTKTKLRRILQKKYDKLKADNPTLSEAQLDKLFVEEQQEYRKQKIKNTNLSSAKKRATIRRKNNKSQQCQVSSELSSKVVATKLIQEQTEDIEISSEPISKSGLNASILFEKQIKEKIEDLNKLSSWCSNKNLNPEANFAVVKTVLDDLLKQTGASIAKALEQKKQLSNQAKKTKKKVQKAKIHKNKPVGRAKKVYGRSLCEVCHKPHEEFWVYKMSNGGSRRYCYYCNARNLRGSSVSQDSGDEWRKPKQEVSGGGVNPR